MLKHIILPTLLGITIFATASTLANADEIMRENCLETAVCYKTDSLK